MFKALLSLLLVIFLSAAAPLHPLVIIGKNGEIRLNVEMATTPEARTIGLMHRSALPENGGMLFDFGEEQTVTMWMKDTLISLDMLFIKANGQIIGIARNTTPFSTKLIPAPEKIRYVLEIQGGASERLGLAVGDTVKLPE
jgi:uncharacterized protein